MLLSTLATIGAVGSAIWGQYKSNQYNKQARADLKKGHEDKEAFLKSEIRADGTNRPYFQSILTRLREVGDERAQRERGVNAVIGGNESGVFAQKKANALEEARVLSDQASRESLRKEGLKNQLMQENANYQQQLANLNFQQGQTVANAAGQVTRAMAGLSTADNNTWGDDLNMFGLDMSNYELHDDGHYYKIPKNQR